MAEGPQRLRKRFHVSLPVRIWRRHAKVRSISDFTPIPRLVEHTFTKNISAKGCYFSLPRELAVGSEIEMEIQTPSVEAIQGGVKYRCHATVVRVETGASGGIGIACQIQRYWISRQNAHLRKARAA